MQDIRFPSLIREDPTYGRVTESAHHNYWVRTIEPRSPAQLLSPGDATLKPERPRACEACTPSSPWSLHALEPVKPACPRACEACTPSSLCSATRSLCTTTREWALLSTTRESPGSNEDLAQSKINKKKIFFNVKLGTSLVVVAKTPSSQCRGPGFDPWSGQKQC